MALSDLPQTLEWVDASDDVGAHLRMIDQRALPLEYRTVDCFSLSQVYDAIVDMTVRGAPALGVCGIAAMALWALDGWQGEDEDAQGFLRCFQDAAAHVADARPTAVNLSWGVDRALRCVSEELSAGADVAVCRAALIALTKQAIEEDIVTNRGIGMAGLEVLRTLAAKVGHPLRVETHCNAGSLATVLYGTATSIIYHAYQEGLIEKVWVDETRPVDQGARLTAWEMERVGVPYTLICDSMAGSIMQQGLVDVCIVGADCICANGDVANKIGTYGLAVLARAHGIPFYVAAPQTTFDRSLPDGSHIIIEQRDAQEVRCIPYGREWLAVAPQGCDVYNPAFDVTPRGLITGIITETGVE